MIVLTAASCSVRKAVSMQATVNVGDSVAAVLITSKALAAAHVGICLYDPAEKTYLYNYQSDKYFIPASNTKIITCYAAMKYLGDSLPGLHYTTKGDTVFIIPTGDPTLLHRDFAIQPVFSFLSSADSNKTICINTGNFRETAWGTGWSWDDYIDDYMAERSAMPVYGNYITIEGNAQQWSVFPSLKGKFTDIPPTDSISTVKRDIGSNTFTVSLNSSTSYKNDIPFYTDSSKTTIALLQQLLKPKLVLQTMLYQAKDLANYKTIYSGPTDSMLKIMMHRSDNFFAEQSLLMVSHTILGVMNDTMVIDTLLKKELNAFPQQPQWVDGSGLSRYNLFTPQDFVYVLDKMNNEFSWGRISDIFPTGGRGTLSNRYANFDGKIFAKTGTLSNNIALSGYLITEKNKKLIFSILVSNHNSNATTIRDLIEQYLSAIISRY